MTDTRILVDRFHGSCHSGFSALRASPRNDGVYDSIFGNTALVVAAVVAIAVFGSLSASHAHEGPWCAVTNDGAGDMHWNCSMRTIEQCRLEVIAGNRGFCNLNPRWPGTRRRAGGVARRGY